MQMENLTILDTGTAAVAGNKLKGEIMENGCSMGNASRKGLTDISNLKQQPEVLNQCAKLLLQPDSLGTKEFIDKLQQKLRINLEKFQQQNLKLAQANSQMLAELNLSKDMLKALKHELGCKNAVLEAIKSEFGTNKGGMEVESHKEDGDGKPCNVNRCSKADESHEEDQGEDKHCNMNRKRQSYCLGPSNVEPVQVKELVKNKRLVVCLRRQSARSKTQEPETTEDVFEVDDPKFLASSTSDDKVLECGPSNIKPVKAKEGIENKSKLCSRRQSVRHKSQEPEATEYVFEVDKTRFLVSSTSDDKVYESGPDIKPVQSKEGIGNKRACLRRQSVRFKAQEPETNKDVFEVDHTRFLVSSTNDDKVNESGQLSSDDSSIKSEHNEGNMTVSSRTEAQELRRISGGRPLRRAVEKVQSYKETKLNVKMRREE
ncbi:Shugoshin C terminus, putative isoform 2 [Hibiscus syriacus]|uniref:Shugoshin C terminus, putative isoform 2 n=1 Tax=Hibiscus syriacus TaxID=106335 RepID=A0A6A3BH77_HIBSY|nr:Shugoshin C terminus, putative isoform 2 [Hibiscus syriacus]